MSLPVSGLEVAKVGGAIADEFAGVSVRLSENYRPRYDEQVQDRSVVCRRRTVETSLL